ncbi:MAG TPA: lipopolysaccharide heptosyltransferase II [Accumulibacter sp.]|nr:lipopolysaccharide heptosyltransferase II [Accumulibacter sp.]HMW17730.1 lipopolysaccharide heptosyltransferase II [Accumulibacter sp.]HMX21638.1 lipopolysaccharide heptosyltransferase II [Accumulibacter sp.]HMY06212.1 lipopolysaccharide heptosyltransferase II [Accumulibacter sp.]HNC19203.1 lipopolysaccharide heptosyltransferase II [Accumulibacter sp.]
MKALIVAPSWIGDTVLAQPLFIRLHQYFPDLRLDALAPRWVAPVLERMPEIAEVIDSPFLHGELALGARRRLARQLASNGYQRAYVLPNSLKSALIPFFAGIAERVGFIGERRYGLINQRHALDKTALPLMVERFAQLAESPGASLPRPLPEPRLVATAEQRAATLRTLGLDVPGKLVVFCPGAEFGPAKRWPARHFATLAGHLAANGHTIWLLGSPNDRPVGDEIAADGQTPILNLCGKTSLAQAIDLLAAAVLVVCNDSGLMHLAAALGRPLVAIYGSSSPGFTPPLSDRAKVVRLPLACSPCFKRECPLSHLDCLNQLSPEQVFDACLEQLAA